MDYKKEFDNIFKLAGSFRRVCIDDKDHFMSFEKGLDYALKIKLLERLDRLANTDEETGYSFRKSGRQPYEK